MAGVLRRERRRFGTQRRPCVDGGREWSYVATNQGRPELAGSSPRASGGLGLADTSILYFWPLELQTESISIVLSYQIYGHLLPQPYETNIYSFNPLQIRK